MPFRVDLTYVASILLKSVERSYVVANISWLIGTSPRLLFPQAMLTIGSRAGSGGTVFLDLIVLGQFIYYNSQNKAGDEYMDDSDSSDD